MWLIPAVWYLRLCLWLWPGQDSRALPSHLWWRELDQGYVWELRKGNPALHSHDASQAPGIFFPPPNTGFSNHRNPCYFHDAAGWDPIRETQQLPYLPLPWEREFFLPANVCCILLLLLISHPQPCLLMLLPGDHPVMDSLEGSDD